MIKLRIKNTSLVGWLIIIGLSVIITLFYFMILMIFAVFMDRFIGSEINFLLSLLIIFGSTTFLTLYMLDNLKLGGMLK